jgi:hypothetical protein
VAGYDWNVWSELTGLSALKVGGQGDQYTIRVCGQDSYLFFERSATSAGNNIGLGLWRDGKTVESQKLLNGTGYCLCRLISLG